MRFLSTDEAAREPALEAVFVALDAAVASLRESPMLAGEWAPSSAGGASAPPLRRDEMQVTCYPGGGAR